MKPVLAVLAVLAAMLWLLALPGVGWAATAAGPAPVPGLLARREIFALLFLMLGPVKILVPFVTMTKGADAVFRRTMATRAILFSAAGLAMAGVVGQTFLANFRIPIPVLILTAGLVLFLVALQTVLEQVHGRAAPKPPNEVKPELGLAISPLAFPVIVTPYGVAAFIIFMSLAGGDPAAMLTVAVLAGGILALDWVAMLYAHVVLRWLGIVLQLLAVVLGIAQVALGLQLILVALARIGVFDMHMP